MGDTVIINMFASTLMPLSDDIILWKINNSAITNGTYSNSKTTLMISDVQLSDAGIYTMVVTVGITNLAFVGSANTVLQVLGRCGQWCGWVWSMVWLGVVIISWYIFSFASDYY